MCFLPIFKKKKENNTHTILIINFILYLCSVSFVFETLPLLSLTVTVPTPHMTTHIQTTLHKNKIKTAALWFLLESSDSTLKKERFAMSKIQRNSLIYCGPKQMCGINFFVKDDLNTLKVILLHAGNVSWIIANACLISKMKTE